MRPVALTLIENVPIPLEAETPECRDDVLARTGHGTCRVEVVDTQQPGTAMGPGINVARGRGQQ